MKMGKNAFVLAALTLVTSMALLYGPTAMVGISQEVEASTLTFADAREPVTFDPAFAYDFASWAQLSNIYETLVKFSGTDTQKVYPCLATSWKISSDATVYSFSLRRGVTFSNGDRFTAWCVEYSFERVINKAGPPAFLLANSIDRVEVLDQYTVRITLKYPNSTFLAILASVAASIVDPDVAETRGDDWMANHTVGTGPYTLKEWVRGKQVELQSNERWWGWAAMGSRRHLTSVLTKIVPDLDERIAMIVNGVVDVASLDRATIEPRSVLPVLGLLQGFEVESQVSFASLFFVMSNRVPPFNDKIVRKAVSYAFNYDAYMTEILMGLHIRSQGIIPNGMFGHVNDLPIPSYNPEKAKQLLSESSHPNGYPITIAIPEWPSYKGIQAWRKPPLLMKESLLSIGWTEPIEVVTVPYSEILGKLTAGDIQMVYWGSVGGYPDPDDFISLLAHSNGLWSRCAGYSNATVDDWVVQARSAPDPEARKTIYRQIELQVFEDTPYILLHQRVNYLARREWVKGIVLNPALYNFLQFSQIYKEYA